MEMEAKESTEEKCVKETQSKEENKEHESLKFMEIQTSRIFDLSDSHPRLFLLTHGVTKIQNVRTLIQSAKYFGAEVIYVGQQKIYTKLGNEGSMIFKKFDSLNEAVEYLKQVWNAAIVGVEIMETSENVETEPFCGNTAFILGSEGHGMDRKQKSVCDKFVYISQYGGGTASLNVAVAASIVIHRFALWAQRSALALHEGQQIQGK